MCVDQIQLFNPILDHQVKFDAIAKLSSMNAVFAIFDMTDHTTVTDLQRWMEVFSALSFQASAFDNFLLAIYSENKP
jgi:hypothetical protein